MSIDVSEELALRVERLNRKLNVVAWIAGVGLAVAGLMIGWLLLFNGFQDDASNVLRERVNRIEAKLFMSNVDGSDTRIRP